MLRRIFQGNPPNAPFAATTATGQGSGTTAGAAQNAPVARASATPEPHGILDPFRRKYAPETRELRRAVGTDFPKFQALLDQDVSTLVPSPKYFRSGIRTNAAFKATDFGVSANFLQAMLDKGVSPNTRHPSIGKSRDSGFGNTLLMEAARHGNSAVVSLLTDLSDVDVEAMNDAGESALELARALPAHVPERQQILASIQDRLNAEAFLAENAQGSDPAIASTSQAGPSAPPLRQAEQEDGYESDARTLVEEPLARPVRSPRAGPSTANDS